MAHPYLLQTSRLKRPPVETALFDFFKVGPGPSSSHTIDPMKAEADFRRRCAALPDEVLARAADVHVTLLGSLSATGLGHGSDAAYSNTLRMSLWDAGGKSLFDMEYYSVGGGFIQWIGLPFYDKKILVVLK